MFYKSYKKKNNVFVFLNFNFNKKRLLQCGYIYVHIL